VILNRVGSEAHAAATAAAIHEATGLRTLGHLPNDAALAVPERHLGLVPAAERGLSPSTLERLTELVSERFDLNALRAIADSAPPLPEPPRGSRAAQVSKTQERGPDSEGLASNTEAPSSNSTARHRLGTEASGPDAEPPGRDAEPRDADIELTELRSPVRVGVAQDRAFGFYYVDTFDLLAELGAQVVPFSALDDEDLPPDLDAVYLGGGFPELYAHAIAANRGMRRALHQTAQRGAPIYAECGGLMALGTALITLDGERVEAFGLLPLVSRMTRDQLTIGYREVEAIRPSALFERGERMRGHEFHWSTTEPPHAGIAAYRLLPAECLEGYRVGSILASYVHLSFAASPRPLARFVRAAAKARESHAARSK
jgi:cobyrinic acid a,c-diamide synthase